MEVHESEPTIDHKNLGRENWLVGGNVYEKKEVPMTFMK